MFLLEKLKYKDILDISELELKTNKVTCIVGESGSGKTTLLKLLNKLISPDSGEITYEDKPLKNIPSVELRRKVAMLPQAAAIFPGTIKDNLLIGLKFAEKPMVSEEKLNQVLQLVKLNKGLKESAEKLSGGEKQRIALARLILLEPEVLLLDEPSSALDEETEQIIFKALVEYARENARSLIMVTHSKKVARDFSDEIVEIKEGKVISRERV
jgi:putative ABC transport system ATP-binding protein